MNTPISAIAGSRNRYGVGRRRFVIADRGSSGDGIGGPPWGRSGPPSSGLAGLLDQLVRSLDGIRERLLGRGVGEQRRLDGLEHEVVDIGLLRDGRDDVRVR